jgi:prevent-host-death family protein
MTHTVSAREANQKFAKLLGQAASGETVVITRRGKAVAQIGPVSDAGRAAERQTAGRRVLAQMREGLDLGGEGFDRDSLYER